MFNASIPILLRISVILKGLSIGVDFSLANPHLDSNSVLLNDEIDKFINDKKLPNPGLIFTGLLERAYNLLEYFNKCKLVMSGYEFDTTETLSKTIPIIIKQKSMDKGIIFN